jgi:hypothetical protein
MSLETALALFAPSDVDTFEAVSGALEQLAYDLDGYKITTKIEEARLNELLGQVKVAIGDGAHPVSGSKSSKSWPSGPWSSGYRRRMSGSLRSRPRRGGDRKRPCGSRLSRTG